MALQPPPVRRFDFDVLHDTIAALRKKQVYFVGGAPKSGTTWLQLLLDAHPEISCSGEGHYADRLLPELSKALKSYNVGIDLKNRSIFEEVDSQPLFGDPHLFYLLTAAISLMLCHSAKARAVRIVGDKTPDNIQQFPLIAVLFPQAKFIHIVRDPRDCAISAWFHNLRLNPETLTRKYPSQDEFAEHYAKVWVNNISRGHQFATEHPDRCLLLRYEDLSREPLPTLAQLYRFLGASSDQAVLQACCAAADFSRLSGGRARGQEDRASFFRRGEAGAWRSHFGAEAERAFRSVAEPWMSNFQY
jgi:hypothetical protein